MCIWTVEARGTPAAPGLGLGLERLEGGTCWGKALELPGDDDARQACLQAIWEREMWTGIYQPRWVDVTVNGTDQTAIAFVVDPEHPQYAGALPVETQAGLIAAAAGNFGTCRAYLDETVAALARAGTRDADLEALQKAVSARL